MSDEVSEIAEVYITFLSLLINADTIQYNSAHLHNTVRVLKVVIPLFPGLISWYKLTVIGKDYQCS